MKSQLSASRRFYDCAARALLYGCSGVTVGLLMFLTGYIFWRGAGSINWTFLTTAESVLRKTVGILPAIKNTVFVILVSLAIALPFGVGAAVYLTEYARNKKLVAVIEFAAETLAGIPSIIYALAGVIIFCTAMKLQKTLLAGSLTLVIMILPTIIRSTQESLKTVPQSYREGALGLGSGKWHMIRTVVLPSSIDGIVTGCILAAGRVVGESAVLMYTAGMSMAMQNFSLGRMSRASGSTLTVALYHYAKENANFAVAFAIAAILLILTAVINLAAATLGKKLKRS